VLVTAEDAARYARINVETLEQWVESGLITTEDGGFIKYNLDLFVKAQGDPTAEDKAKQVESIQELAMALRTIQNALQEGGGAGARDPVTGLSPEELEKMDISQVMELLRQRQE